MRSLSICASGPGLDAGVGDFVRVGDEVEVDGAGKIGLPVVGGFGEQHDGKEDVGKRAGQDERAEGTAGPTLGGGLGAGGRKG